MKENKLNWYDTPYAPPETAVAPRHDPMQLFYDRMRAAAERKIREAADGQEHPPTKIAQGRPTG